MTNCVPDNLATPTVLSFPYDFIIVPSGNAAAMMPWFISSDINSDPDRVMTYMILQDGGQYLFELSVANMPPANTGVFVSLLCDRELEIVGGRSVRMFDTDNSNIKCWYHQPEGNTQRIRFKGNDGSGPYSINFINVSPDDIFFLNSNWEQYECQDLIINGLPLSQLGFQTADWFDYEMGFSVPDRQSTVKAGHLTSSGGYDNEFITIPLRLDFSHLAGITEASNAYEAAMDTVNFLIDYMKDTNLYVSFKQKRDTYTHCFYNSIIQLSHENNIFKFELKLQKIMTKGTSSFSLEESTLRFKSIEFILSNLNTSSFGITDQKYPENYFYVTNAPPNTYMIETMFFKDNTGNRNIIKNEKHYLVMNYALTRATIQRILYLE